MFKTTKELRQSTRRRNTQDGNLTARDVILLMIFWKIIYKIVF